MNTFQRLLLSKIPNQNGPWIAPSLLSCDFLNMGKQLELIEHNGADIVHLDIMDGHFVPNISFGPPIVKAVCEKTILPKIAHLMINNPIEYANVFAKQGVEGISFHIETEDDPIATLKKIQSFRVACGIAIKPSTPLKNPEILVENADFVLIMSVEPGFSGQSFMEEALLKIEKIAEIREKMNKFLPIEVDGGVNKDTGKLCRDAGADILVSGNYVYKASDVKQAIDSLR